MAYWGNAFAVSARTEEREKNVNGPFSFPSFVWGVIASLCGARLRKGLILSIHAATACRQDGRLPSSTCQVRVDNNVFIFPFQMFVLKLWQSETSTHLQLQLYCCSRRLIALLQGTLTVGGEQHYSFCFHSHHFFFKHLIICCPPISPPAIHKILQWSRAEVTEQQPLQNSNQIQLKYTSCFG